LKARLVLCYHAISPTWSAPLSVRPDEFERQLAWFARHGWQAVTFADLASSGARDKQLAVTFDDAFLSVLTRARPILDALGMPATVFAPTAFMQERQPLRWAGIDHWAQTDHAPELQSMSWEDLGELTSQGWEIGSHTQTHPLLTMLDDATATAELRSSRDEVEQAIGRACRSIAYPYGGVDDRIAGLAREAGYAAGAGLSRNLRGEGPYRWPRLGVYNADRWTRFMVRSNPLTRGLRRTRLWPDSVPAVGVSRAR
jgi:peptidoglycan/xylan/chitin deacetylase (PgdA/CDA1 family)